MSQDGQAGQIAGGEVAHRQDAAGNVAGNPSASGHVLPRPTLAPIDGVAMMIGIVVGIGIFKTPQLVAQNAGSEAMFLGLWLLGGVVTLVGALVYAELGAAHPSTGGEYHFLSRGLGRPTGLMFAWARLSVIQTGAIAAVAFVFGDYAQQLMPLGSWGSSIYAAAALIVFTGLNVLGAEPSKGTQRLFTALTVALIGIVAVLGLSLPVQPAVAPAQPLADGSAAAGLAMIFILLTFGGWNEMAYLSAELKDVRRNMTRVLFVGTGVIAAIYLFINIAYLNTLGLEGIRSSDAVASDAMRAVAGEEGARLLAVIVCCAALSTLNATIFMGSRLYHAIGNDLAPLRWLAAWDDRGKQPRTAVLLQSAIVLALIGFGAMVRDGFQAMVEYTAPVFWFFLLLVGIAFFRLRKQEGAAGRPFRVPLYPLTPVLFCLICAALLYSSLVHTGLGALVGVAVLLLGLPVLLLDRRTAVAPSQGRPPMRTPAE